MDDGNKRYYVQLPGYQQGEIWDEDKYNRNKEQLFNEHKDAVVMETAPMAQDDTIGDNDMFTVHLPGFPEAEAWDAAKLNRNREQLLKEHPDAEIVRATPVDYWGDRLNAINAEISQLKPQQESALAAANDPALNMRTSFDDLDTGSVVDAARRSQQATSDLYDVQSRLDTLYREREDNPAFQSQKQAKLAKMDEATGRIDEMFGQLNSTNPQSAKLMKSGDDRLHGGARLAADMMDNPDYYRDYEALAAAKMFYDDARKKELAPSKYDDTTGFGNFFRGLVGEAPETLSPVALGKSIAKNVPLAGAIKAIHDAEGKNANIVELVTQHPERLSYLSPAQKELVTAFVVKSATDWARAEDLSLGYQSGSTAMQSLGFMADFFLMGGLGDAAAKSATGWLTKGLAKASMEMGLKGGARELALAAPKFIEGTFQAAVKTAVMTPFMPSSYANLFDNLTRINDAGQVDMSGKAIRNAIGDVFIENLSESAGAQVEAILGVPFKMIGKTGLPDLFANTKFGAWGKAVKNAPITKILTQAGFNGYIGEIGEEWYGNALRVMTGVDKNALKDFATVDQQIVTLTSFAPMTLFGGATSTAQYLASKKQMAEAGKILSSVLEKNGYDQQTIQNFLDVTQAENPTQLADKLAPVIVQAAKDNADAPAVYKAVMDYAQAVARYRTLDGVSNADIEQQRQGMLDEITAQVGGLYFEGLEGRWIRQTQVQDGSGNALTIQSVRTLTDNDGNELFVVGEQGDMLATVNRRTGENLFVFQSEIEAGTYTDSGAMSLNDFLDRELVRKRQADDRQRMELEQLQNQNELMKRAQPGTEVNLGTVESPMQGTIVQFTGGKFIVQGADGSIREFDQQEMANILELPLTPVSQEQQEAADADELVRRDNLRDRANTMVGRNIAPILGREGDLELVQVHRAVENLNGLRYQVDYMDNGTMMMDFFTEDQLNALVGMEEQTPAVDVAEQTEQDAHAPADDTPRDFRGNPLPMRTNKKTGQQTVDQNALWNKDPEAWARWNDTNPNQRVTSKERLEYTLTELNKEIEKDTKAVQKAALKGIDEDEMDNMEAALGAKLDRRELLQSILNKYNLPAEAGATIAGEQRKAAAEQVKREQLAGFPGIQQKWNDTPKAIGAPDEIRLPNGETVTGKYVLTEATAPTASHNPANGFAMTEGFPVDENGKTVNDRDYERDKDAQTSVLDKAANYDQRALQTPVIVSSDGVVLSGNDRTMASQIAADNNTDGAYQDYLNKYPQKYGFTAEQVKQFAHPRVVFVPDAAMPYNAATFAKFNAEEKKSQSKTEKAVKAGKTLNAESLGALASLVDQYDDINALYNSKDGVNELLNILLSAEVISQEQVAALRDGDTLSGTGMDLLESTLIGAALDEEAVRIAMSDKSIRKSVVSAISQILVGNTLNDYNLRTELTDAITLVANGKALGEIKFGESVQDYIRQQHLFMDDVVAEASVQLLADAINDRKTSFLKKVLSLYNRDAVDAANGQMNLLTGDVLGRGAILRNILEYLGYDTRIIYDTSERAAEQRGPAEPAEPAGPVAPAETGQAPAAVQGDEGSEVNRAQYDREEVAAILEQGNVGEYNLADYMTDEEVSEFMRRWEAFLPSNDALGEAYNRLDADLHSGDKKKKKSAQAEIDRLEQAQVEAHAPVQEFVDGLIEKYGKPEEEPVEEEIIDEEIPDEGEFGGEDIPEGGEDDGDEEPEPPKGKKGKKAKTGKKNEEKPKSVFTGKHSDAELATVNYTQDEWDQLVYGGSMFSDYTSKKTGEKIEIVYSDDQHPVYNDHQIRFWIWQKGAEYGDRRESVTTTDYMLRYLKLNGFKQDKPSAKKNKYGYWVNTHGVIVNPIRIELPSTHKGWANMNYVSFAQNDKGKWTTGASFHTATGGYSGPVSGGNNREGFDTKTEAIKYLIQSAEKYLNANYKGGKSKTYEQRDLENLINTLKTKTLPQAMLEEGVVETVMRVDLSDAGIEGTQGDLFGGEIVEEPVAAQPVSRKPAEKRVGKKKKAAKPAKQVGVDLFGEEIVETSDEEPAETDEGNEPRFQIEDEEGTPGNFHWIEERVCTNPQILTMPGADRLGSVPKVALAEKNGKWFAAPYVVADGGNGSAWGSEIPTFKSSYIAFSSRKEAIQKAIEYMRYLLNDRARKAAPYGETFNETKSLIDYLVKMELPKEDEKKQETAEDALGFIKKSLDNFASNGNYARVVRTLEAYQDFFGEDVAQEIDTILSNLRKNGISKESKDEMVRRTAELYNRLVNPASETETAEETATPVQDEKPAAPAYGSQNTIITTEKYEELKKRMLEKLGQLNAGFDPEVFFIGAQMAAYHVEAGARKFVDFAQRMINDLGDAVRPYLKAIYNGARDLPGMEGFKPEMDSAADVDGINVDEIGVEEETPAVQEPAQPVEAEATKKAAVQQVDVNALFGAVNDMYRGKRSEVKLSDFASDIKDARENTDTNPSDAQKEAGNYKKGHISIDGYDISLENPKGSVRSGKDANGNEWSVTMNNDYGYIRMTEGVDGDHIDVFLSDNPTQGNVFVVDQVNEDGSFDEHKVMYGFESADEASKAYLANYSPGWKGLGAITEVTKDEFKKWVDSSHRKTKPFAEYKSVNPVEDFSDTAKSSDINGQTLGELGKYTHTKTGKEMSIVRLTGDRVSADEFKQLKARAKEFGGYYSSYGGAKGFLFENEADAIKFNTINAPENAEEQTDVETAADTAALVSEAASVAIEAESLAENEAPSEQESAEVIERIDTALDAINDQLALLGYYEADTTDQKSFNESYGYMKTAEKKAVKDAEKLARHLAFSLGIEVGRKKMAQANVAPAGGDITFRLPLNEGSEVYVDISVVPDLEDNLFIGGVMGRKMAIMYRIEQPSETGPDKYGTNNFAPYNVSYADLLKGIRSVAKDYLPKAPATAEQEGPVDVLQVAKEQAEKNRKSAKKTVSSQEEGDAALGGLFATLNDAEEPDAVEEDNTDAPAARVKPTEVNGYKIGEKVQYRPSQGDRSPQTATIYDFEYDGRPVLDTGLAPVLYEVVDWEQVSKIEQEPVNETDNASSSEQPQGVPAGAGSQGEEAGQESAGSDRGGEGGRERDLHGRSRSLRPRYDDSVKRNTRNNRVAKGEIVYPKTPSARFKANIAAIRLLKELQDSGKDATKEQMAVLRQYTGWGGLGGYFNNEYTAEHRELKSLLTDEEMAAAALSINTAYYTPVEVIDNMWEVAKRLGFEGGNILEGSAGTGAILASMPKAISERSAITAVELDNITGGILRLLYPDATVHVQGFQETDIDNGSIDLAITNVPFGDINVYDSKEKDITRKFGGKIHDFCIAKNIRKLAPGGLGIFISTRGTLDNSSKTLRQWIVNEGDADVIGAFRLNNETFEGTGATSDIIVVRKRVNGNVSPNAIDVTDTQITRREDYELSKTEWNPKTRSYERIQGKAAMEINSYFVEHPEDMGGEMGFGFEHKDEYRPGSSALWPSEKIDQNKRLAKWAKQFSSMKAEEQAVRTEAEPAVVEDSNATKEGQLVTNSKGEICISRSGKAIPIGVNAQKVKGYSKAQVLSDYDALKNAINEVLDYQLKNESDEGLKPLLSKLNRAYDTFAHRYSRLNRNTAISFLRNDVDFPAIAAVEDYKEKKSIDGKVKIEVKKTSIFSGRVLGAKRVPTPKDAKDGVIVSMNQFGRIDVPFIADALNKNEETVRKEILDSGLGFENPQTGGIEVEYEYLSGNVREKLEYAREHNTEGKYDKNISALEKVVPADIPAHLIEFSLGSDWMPVELYTEYAKEKFDVNDNFKPFMLGGSWALSDNEWDMNIRTEKNRAAGVHSEVLRTDKYGHELMIAAMNNSSIVFSRSYKDPVNGQTITESDKEATQAATQKMSEMRDDFKEWARAKMLDDPGLAQRVAKVYNDTFNAIVPKEIKSTFLPEHFEGMATKLNNGKELHLREHQAKAVIRGTTEPLMLAHEVGTGKTFTLIATAMEMRRLGTAKKPMIVVQNATLGQFVSSAKELYPNAKVLTISEADRTVEGRTAFYAKIKYNDWDMIIVPQSVFEMIPDSEERQRAFIQEKIEEKEFILEQAKQAKNSSAERQLKKELEDLQYEYQYGEKPPKNGKKDAKKEAEAKANAVAKAKKQLDRRTDDVSDFDDMGIDALLVDEAHSYKHLGFSTAMQRGVKGVDATGSKKSAGVYLKTRAVFDKAGWKNVVFATGTPISNTAAEIWTFMKYLMPDDMMRQNHIYYFDDFVRNFGNIAQSLEFTTSGKFKENTRFASYTNLPELIRIWWSVCDTVRSEDAVAEGGAKLEDKQPKMEDWTGADGREHVNQARDIYLPQSGSLVDIMNAVRSKLEWYENLSGKEKKENSHIPLTMFGIAKMAAIDPRLVDREAPDEPNSKTNKAVEETLKALKDSERYHGTCALFCDNFRRWDTDAAGRRTEGFNIFEEIKRKLMDAGVPEDQIVIMKSGMNTALKEKIFARVNAGEVRVIMGTTATLGTGVNIQERLFFEAHLDAPNRPMDYTQRNGRILRQGNLHRDWGIPVRVVRFGVEDSLDVTAYQRLSTKSKFIDSVMNGKPLLANGMDNRVLEEAEEGEFDNPVAVLSGSQYALLKSQAERELRKLRNKKEQYRQDQIYIERTLKENGNRIAYDKKLIDEAQGNLAKIKSAFPDGGVKEITISGRKVKGTEQISEAVKEKITGPLRELAERRRNERGFTTEDKHYTMTFDGVSVDVKVSLDRVQEWNDKTFEYKYSMRTRIEYSCPAIGLDGHYVSGGLNGIKDIPQDFIDLFISGRYFEQSISNLQNTIARLNADNDLMLQRRGKPFAEEEKLQKQEEIVKDYTEKMKAEMAEKEKKYADMAKNASGSFNLDDVEVDEDEDGEGEGETHNSEVDENAPKLNMNDPTVVAEAVSAVNRVARRLGLRVVFDNQLGSKGAYTEGTDFVRINLSNCESVDDAVETLLHEGVAHFGLREMLGEQGMREFIDDILTKAAPSIRRKIQRLADENGWSMEYAAEEYVAELAQKTDYTKAERSLWRRILDAVRNLISSITGRETHITDDTIREMLVASYARLEEAAADIFDNSLQRQIDGTLPEGYVHKLGLPGEILRSVGVPNLPIELAASRLAQKAENHGYDLSELKGLVEAINDPVAVFQRGKQDNIGRDIIVEIEHNGKNLVVGMYLNPVVDGQHLEINSIRTVYPKDTDEWVRWIKYGRAWYLDKERIKAIIAEQRMTFADVSSDDLNDIANIIDSFENSNTSGEFVDGVTHYRKVTDKALLSKLENGPTETGYRNVAMNADGSFGSPMAGKLGKRGGKSVSTSSFALNEWEMSEENPDMATEDGKINLIKPQGRGNVDGVDYNPYIHIRPTMLNRQFTQAWKRPELVYVETSYPSSELSSGYHAEKAKLSVGRHPWNGGELILSRYDKPMRIVPWDEVAEDWVAEYASTGVTFDIVPPELLPILAQRGVEILPPKKAAGAAALHAYNEWRDNNPSGPGSGRKIASDLYDRYENQNGEDKPWLSENEFLDMVERELPRNAETKPLLDMIGQYRSLAEEDFNEGRRDFSGGEMEDMFNDFLSMLQGYASGRPVRNRVAGVDGFISNAEAAVNAIQMEKATPQQWLKMIEGKGGLKAGEDKWIGLSDWLKASDRKTLTKQEVLDYIAQNRIQIEEAKFIEEGDEEAMMKAHPGFNHAFIVDQDFRGEIYINGINDLKAAVELYNRENGDKITASGVQIMGEDYEKLLDFGDRLLQDFGKISETRLKYTTEGLSNKREIALWVPSIEPWNWDDRIHFGEVGNGRAIAWARFGDAKDIDGNRVLVIDEIQSKRHQDAREKGYIKRDLFVGAKVGEYEERTLASGRKVMSAPILSSEGEKIGTMNKTSDGWFYGELSNGWETSALPGEEGIINELNLLSNRDGIPSAPFEKNWHELAMKRMLRLAAEEGYDYVAWTTGDQQAERYSLSNSVSSISSIQETDENKKIDIKLSNRNYVVSLKVDSSGKVISSDEGEFRGKNLSEIVGKEVSQKLMSENTTIEADDLKIGGEGMKGFYDEILPRFMNKYGKKWGVKVEDIYLPNVEADARIMHAVRITPEMRESVKQGQMMFREGERASQSPVSYNESTGAKRLAASETARKFGVEIEFRPSSEMRFNGKPLAGRWINGKMYICPEHCRDNDDAVRTVLHEGVGHNGLRRLIGDENMREFCLDLFRSLPKSVRNKIASDAVTKYGGNVVESVERFAANDVIREVGKEAMFESTEEWLAETSETIDYDNYRRNVWDIIRDALRRVLAKVGINVPLSMRDVKWLMVQSAVANHETDPLVEARRQVVANSLGFTLRQQTEKAEAVQLARNKIAEQHLAEAARIYNKDVLYWFNRLHETWVDKDNAVHQLVNAIEKATGKAAKAFEDIRLSLNQQSSKGLAAIEKFERECWNPMQEAIRTLMDEKGIDLHAVERYVMIKHGLERNEVFAKRDAREFYQDAHDTMVKAIENSDKIDDLTKKALIAKEDAKLTKHLDAVNAGSDAKYLELRRQDYGGLTAMYSEYDPIEPFMEGVESEEEYQARVLQSRHPKYTYIDEAGREQVDMAATEEAAQQEVNEFENGYDDSVKELWKRINAATKFTLKHQYDANMMSRDQYQAVSGMFKYYVPLRGFADNTAEDMYDYYQSDQRNDFTPPLLKAKGRKTEAESPFGYIGSMASSGIAADMKNETKLALYYFVSNRANNDLVTISEVWYKNTGVDELGRRIFTPVYPPFNEDLSSEEAKQAYEDWEKQMQEEAKAGFAFKGGKKLNLKNSVIHIDERQKSSHVIKFKVGGRDLMMYINGNPRAAQAINNELNVEMSTDYQKVFGKVLRWFSGINTSYNPEFWLSNAQRDILFALMSVNVKEDSEYNAAFRKNLGQLVMATLTPGKNGGAYSLKKKFDDGKLGDERLDRLYQEFVENGGVTGYTTLKNNEEWELELRKFTGDQKKAMQAVKTVFEKVQNFGEAIEQMTRFSAYITSREQGKEIKEAVNDAKELTVNFNRKGSGKAISFKEAARLRTKNGKKLTALQKAFVVGASWLPVYGRRFIMFFNASTQGLNAMYKLYKKNGKGMALWTAGYLALGVMQAAIHALLDDDDDYLDIPDYERRNNLLLGGGGVYFKWAIPQEARVFYAIGDMAVNHALGREPNKDSFGGWTGEIASVLSDIAPLNPTGGLSALAPSALTPIVEIAMNRDYKGAKIFNDLRYLSDEERKRTPAYQRAYQGTGKVYVLLSQSLNWMTGGDYADAGWINPVNNPAAWEHILQGATGGAGTTIGKFYRGTIGQVLGEDFTVRNTPFLSRLFTVTDDRYRNAHTTELFDYYKAEAEHTKKLINTYRKNGDDKKLDRLYESEDYEIMTIYDSYKSQFNYYNDELKATTDKKDRKALMREQDAVRKEMIMEISNIGKND